MKIRKIHKNVKYMKIRKILEKKCKLHKKT